MSPGSDEWPGKARFVSEMFTRIAGHYDLMNGLMTFGMHHACLHPHRLIVGADFAHGMLQVAEVKRRADEGRGRIALVEADALELPFERRTFAFVTSAFLLRNLADLKQGLAEMRRVARPGGRIVALEITQADIPGWAPLFRMYFHHVVPRVGALVGGDREAYTYLPQSVDRFLRPPALAALMEAVGLRGVKYRRLGLGSVTIHTGIA